MPSAESHPNYKRATEVIAGLDNPNPALDLVQYWQAVWGAKPWYLDLDTGCPKCGAGPFRPCHTDGGYHARTHAARRKACGVS